MAKVLCITSGLTGILNASFELVNRLEADGHKIIYASPKPVGNKVEAQGIIYKQLSKIKTENIIDIPNFKGPLKKVSRLLYKIANRKRLQRDALNNIKPSDFEDLVKNENPDLLIIDIELHEYILTAYRYEVPMILLSQWFSLWKRKGLPYLLHDTVPGIGWSGTQFGMDIAWGIVRIKRWWTFLKKKVMSVSTDRRSVLLKYGKEVNFPLEYLKENNWPGPFTYDQLPVIAMVAEEIELEHSKRPNLTYVGPMVAENRKEVSNMESINHKISEVIQIKENSEAKLLYCSVSTLHPGDLDFINRLIEAVANKSEWLLIIGLGGMIDDKRFEQLPENVFAFSYIPQLKILRHANLSINHGGIHTINECIHNNVPMLVYSGKRSDQNGCAVRVRHHNLGIMADKDLDSTDQIREKIELVLESKTFKKNIIKLNIDSDKYRKNKVLESYICNTLNLNLAKTI